jgi:hypothetical protein
MFLALKMKFALPFNLAGWLSGNSMYLLSEDGWFEPWP